MTASSITTEPMYNGTPPPHPPPPWKWSPRPILQLPTTLATCQHHYAAKTTEPNTPTSTRSNTTALLAVLRCASVVGIAPSPPHNDIGIPLELDPPGTTPAKRAWSSDQVSLPPHPDLFFLTRLLQILLLCVVLVADFCLCRRRATSSIIIIIIIIIDDNNRRRPELSFLYQNKKKRKRNRLLGEQKDMTRISRASKECVGT